MWTYLKWGFGDSETSSVQPRLTWQMVNELYAIHTNQDSKDIKWLDSKLKPSTTSQASPRPYSGSLHATLHSCLFAVIKLLVFSKV